MIKHLDIERFKSIEKLSISLDKINVIVGGNNAGKSSVLHAIQFLVSIAQTAKVYSSYTYHRAVNVAEGKGHNIKLSTSLSPNQLFYSPLENPYKLGSNADLPSDSTKSIRIALEDADSKRIDGIVSKGKNRNISVELTGNLVKPCSSLEELFSMYVPGISGISFSEEIRSVGAVRNVAAKGDSNTVFRNVLRLLNQRENSWNNFLKQMNIIFPGFELKISSNDTIDGLIDVSFSNGGNGYYLPIDLAGTGILQAMQIIAYVSYFSPKLLLLDEPDSHLHPNNQVILAQLLSTLVDENDLTIIVSTHSRHLMSALKNEAKFFLMKNGSISESEYSHYNGLIELGALDDYDLIKKGTIRNIILTEDSTRDSHNALSVVLQASGLEKDSFRIYPYNSVSNIESARLFANFLSELNPSLNIIIYRDLDGLTEQEAADLKEKLAVNDATKIFISRYNDVEMYLCNAEHVYELYKNEVKTLNIEKINELLSNSISDAERTSKEKLISHRSAIAKSNRQDNSGRAAMEALEMYENDKRKYSYGKKVLGVFKNNLQKEYHRNFNLCQVSNYIKEPNFTI
ncbi:MAG: AAA family ATPase [Clostridia bacterium]|nr:AAA family ATPase [Clostridia bacterium]